MRLRSQLVNVKQIPAGAGVSYGLTWTAAAATTVGLVPLGYGDGIPRHASNRAWVGWSGTRVPVRGRICMDQFVVELGAEKVAELGRGSRPVRSRRSWRTNCCRVGGLVRHHRLRDRDPYWKPCAAPLSPCQSGAHLMAREADWPRASGWLPASPRWRPAGSRWASNWNAGSSPKRIARTSEADLEAFFSLRSDGPDVTTPDGVVLHTEVDEGCR